MPASFILILQNSKRSPQSKRPKKEEDFEIDPINE
jgi:hypothetical protein